MPWGKDVEGAVERIFRDAEERGQQACFGYLSQKERDKLEKFKAIKQQVEEQLARYK